MNITYENTWYIIHHNAMLYPLRTCWYKKTIVDFNTTRIFACPRVPMFEAKDMESEAKTQEAAESQEVRGKPSMAAV